MNDNGFGLAPLRFEGTMIDPDTGGSVTTPEREQEVRAIYAQRREEAMRYRRSLAGRWEAFCAPFVRAWRAFFDWDYK